MFKPHNHISQISSELSYCSKDTSLCFHLSSKCPSSRVKHCWDDLRWRKTEVECLHSDSEKSKLLVAAGNEIFYFQGTAYIFCYTNIQWKYGEEKTETKDSVYYKEKGEKVIHKRTCYIRSVSHYKNSELPSFLFLSFPDFPFQTFPTGQDQIL